MLIAFEGHGLSFGVLGVHPHDFVGEETVLHGRVRRAADCAARNLSWSARLI
jgi:hypothetical protein